MDGGHISASARLLIGKWFIRCWNAEMVQNSRTDSKCIRSRIDSESIRSRTDSKSIYSCLCFFVFDLPYYDFVICLVSESIIKIVWQANPSAIVIHSFIFGPALAECLKDGSTPVRLAVERCALHAFRLATDEYPQEFSGCDDEGFC